MSDQTATIKGITKQLEAIRDERMPYANTATRIGEALLSLLSLYQNTPYVKKEGEQRLIIGDIYLSWDKENNAVKVSKEDGSAANFYAVGGISAFGTGSIQGGGGSGMSYERLDNWADYSVEKATAVLSAFLGNDLNERLKKVEGGALTSVDWSIIKNKPTSMPASDVPAWAKAATKPSYAWSEITGKPNEFNPAAHSHSFASLTGKPNTLQGYGITDAASISHTHTFLQLKDKPTTLQGYGITDAKIAGGTITLGTGTITPLTVHQPIYALTLQKNGVAIGSFNPKSANATLNITVPTKLSQLTDDIVSGKYLSLNGGTMQNTNIVKNLNAELLGGVKLMSAGASRGIMQAWNRGHFKDLNDYFGNGNVVVCDPQAENGLSPNDTIFSLGDSAWRNVQLVFPYPIRGMYYRYNLDGKWSAFRHFAFVDDNVASATKLQNMRKIWGQDFDGTGDVDGMLTVKHTGYSGVKLISTVDESSYRCQCSGGNEWVFGGYPTRFFLWNNAAKHVFSILNNGNVVIGDTEVDSPYKLNVKGTMRIGDSLLLAGTEYCDITTIRNANSAIKNAAVTVAAIRHALDFAWYSTHYQVGNIRGGSTDSLGFGITKDNSTLIARFHESGSEFYGNLTVDGYLSLANNVGLTLKDKEGSNQRAVFISSSNTVYFGCNDRPLYTLFEGDELQFNVYNNGWQNALVISRDRTAIFTGNVLAMGGVTAYTTSDRRLKENIKDVDSMRIIRSLGGTWQFDYKDTGEHSIGFIAQSVKGSALKSMVYTNSDGYMKLNYLDTRLIALALGAAVQVDDKVERLKKRIKVLEKEIEKLKGGEK